MIKVIQEVLPLYNGETKFLQPKLNYELYLHTSMFDYC